MVNILNKITYSTHFLFMFMFVFILILILVLMFILILLLDFFRVDFRLKIFKNTVCIPYFYYNKKITKEKQLCPITDIVVIYIYISDNIKIVPNPKDVKSNNTWIIHGTIILFDFNPAILKNTLTTP